MAYNAQNGGVYILINGDASPLQRKLDELRSKVGKTARQIEAEMQGAFGRADISRAANSAISAFARLRTSVRAVNTDLQGHQREWVSLGRQIGLTTEQAQKLARTVNDSVHAQNIRNVESSLRTLQRQTGMATSEIIKLAREMGAVEVAGKKAFSELGIRSAAQIKKEIKSLAVAYIELKRSGVATAQDLARAHAAMRQRVTELRNELYGISPASNAAYDSLKRIGLAAISISAVTSSIKTLIDAMVEMDSIKVAYQSIFGLEDKSVGVAQLSYIYDLTQKLGLEFKSTAESAKGFFAASKGTSLEKDMHKIFEGFSEASSALHLSSERVKGIFLALSQMVSKGKVSMEELRQQLGEQLPGAFKDAATAMGKTTQEFDKIVSSGQVIAEELLPKMAEVMHNKWGAAAVEASGSVQSAINKLNADWNIFKANFLNSDAVKKGIEGVHSALRGLDSVLKTLSANKEILFSILTGAGAAGGIALISKYAASIGALGTTLMTLASQAKAAASSLGAFLITNPWTAVAAAIGTATAALTYFTQKVDAAAQSQKVLTSAQEEAVNISKVLNDQAVATLKQTEDELKAAQLQYQAMVTHNEMLLKSLAESIHEEVIPFFGAVRASTDQFTEALENLALQTARTGDFSTLEAGIRQIEAQARIAGKETDTFRKYVEQLRAACAAGINLHVQLTGYQEAISKLVTLAKAKAQFGDTFDPLAKERENDILKRKISNISVKWGSTTPGKIASNKDIIAQYKEMKGVLSDSKKLTQLGMSAEDASSKIKMLDDLIADTEKKTSSLLGTSKKAGRAAHSSAVRAANAQGTYNTTLENTISHIESLKEQLKLDKSQSIAQKKIALEQKYAAALKKTNEQIEKQIRSGSISVDKGRKLQELKAEENALELQVKLRELETRSVEESLSHLQEQIGFYNSLTEVSGKYTDSVELQNKVIDIQAQKYRDLKTIPGELIDEWAKWQKLQNSVDPFDGAYRGLLRFSAEMSDSAKQWEDLTYNYCKNFEKSAKSMFDDFLETGKLSFSSFEQLFKQLLKDLAYYALVQPIVLSMIGGTGAGSSVGGATGAGTGGATSQVANALVGSAQSFLVSKIAEPIKDYAAGVVNSAAATLFPGTFASTAEQAAANAEMNIAASMYTGSTTAPIASASTTAPTQTFTGSLSNATSGMSGIATMGAGIVGSALGNYVVAPALGINTSSTGSQIGGMVGGMGGSLAGAQIGAMAGSWGGPIGAGVGALVGTVAGLLAGGAFGGGEDLEPGYYINAWTDLTSKKGLKGYSKGTATQDHRWDGFGSGTAKQMREQVARPMMEQMRQTTAEIKDQLVAVGGKSLGESFYASVRKNQRSPTPNTGKYGEDLSQFFQIHGEWGDTNSPDIETWSKNIGKQYQEVMVKSIASMDMSAIAKASDGFVANTETEIAQALIKAGSLIAIGDSIEDEELQETFRTGISKSLIKALKKMRTSGLGLDIDKTSLEGWATAAQAMQLWQEVNTTLDGMLNPVSEIEGQFNSIQEQFTSWEASLSALGWQTRKINEIDKKRIDYVKKYADEVMRGFESQDEVVEHVKEINKAFADVAEGLKQNGVSGKDYQDVSTRRDAVLREYINGILGQFEQKNDLEEGIRSIQDAFASAISAMREASDTFTEAEIKNAEKLRNDAVRSSVSESLNKFDIISNAQSIFNETAEGIKAIVDAMQAAPDVYSASEIEAAQKKGADAMRRQASEMLAQYDALGDIENTFIEVTTHFSELADAMRETKNVFTASDIESVQKKSAEIMRKQMEDYARQYDVISEAEENLVGISTYFSQIISAAKKNSSVFTNKDIAATQKKATEAMRRYVSSVTDSYKKTNALKAATDQTAKTFDDLIAAMKKVGMSVEEVSAVEKMRAQELDNIRADAVRGYNQDLDIRYNTLKNGADTDTTSLLSLWYSQNSELDKIADDIGRNTQQYAATVQVQQAEYLQKQIEILQKQLKTLLQDQLTATTAQLNAATSLKNTFLSLSKSLRTALKNLWTTESNLTGTKYSEAYKEFNETYKKALSGDTDALNDLPNIGQNVLTLAKEQLKTRGEYDTAFYDISKKIRKAGDYAEKQLSLAQTDEARQQALVDSINAKIAAASGSTSLAVNTSVESLQALIAQYQSRLEDLLKQIAGNTGIMSDNIVVLRSLNNGTAASKQAILDTKAQLMKYGETIGNRQLTQAEIAKYGNMTSKEVLASIEETGMTFDEWYQRYGVKEFDEAAKRAGIVVNSIEDLSKITDAYDNLLAAKADSLNKQMVSSGKVAAGGWTAQKVLEAINKSGLTVAQWYEQFGRAEGFTLSAAKTTNTVLFDLEKVLQSNVSKLNDGTSTSRQAILETKAQLMKYGEAIGKGQLSQAQREAYANMTSDQILKSIEDSGLTFDEWYSKYGSNELIEAAKNAGVVVNSIEDLSKITDAYDRLLAQKAQSLNDSMYSTAKVAAGGWTSDLVRQEILSRGMTVKEWYDKYGRSEGFLLNIFGESKSTSAAIKDQTAVLKTSILGLNNGSTQNKNAILETKATLMKYGEALGKGQLTQQQKLALGNTTAQSVLENIKKSGLSFDDWYSKYGSKEIQEAAKNTGVVVNSIADLKKITDAYDNLLAKKADTLNASLYSTSKVAAGGWTADLVRQEIASRGMTVKEWYDKYGKSEGLLLNINSGANSVKTAIQDQTAALQKSILSLNNGSTQNKNAILETKATLMKYGEALGKGQLTQEQKIAAGNATSQSVLASIQKNGLSFNDWYSKYGSKEILEAAKNTGVVVNSVNDLKKITDAYDRLLSQKADTLNTSLYTTSKVAAGGWTADLVRQEINSRGMTVKEWYDKYGSSEGYLLGINRSTADEVTKTVEGISSVTGSVNANTSSTATGLTNLGTNLGNYLNSKFSSVTDMLNAKVESLNQSAYLGKTNWTVEDAVKKMENEYGSVENWFNNVGKNESFAQTSTSSSNSQATTSKTTSSSSTSSKTTSSQSTTSKTTSSSTSTKSTANTSKSTSSNYLNSKYATETALLQAKANALNKQKYQGKTNWTTEQVKQEIIKKCGSIATWYTQYGKAEGFAKGGFTPENEPFWVGERGPELMMSRQSYGVLNNKDSLSLMRGLYSAASVDDSTYIMIHETNNILRQTLRKVSQMEYDLHRNKMYLQKWDNDGLPATSSY